MSADNWAICPQCKKRSEKSFAVLEMSVEKKYGKIPSDEYLELLKKAKHPPELKFTLREDYEIRTDTNGKFKVNYNCRCTSCGFKYEFSHVKQLME